MSGVEGLKPCPFCGGEASDAGHTKYSRPLDDAKWLDGSPVREAFFVNCIPCGASSRNSLFGGYQTKAEAIAAWNRRTPPATPIAGGVGSSPDGDTHRAAETAVVGNMVQRFLSWRLPEDFNPDNGISFKPTFNDHMDPPMRRNPTGTNLFDARQAEAMVRHMLGEQS